jgi:serine/threonine protein kinase/formylglycine-generating enzyme required for sulfatase activity
MNQSDFLRRFQYNTRADLIGGGGFGKVYRAYDDLRDRYVAIKIAEVTDGYEHLSLKKEAELSRNLSVHKNIAYYEDCFRFEMPNGLYDYGILQYYPDGNLSEFIKKTFLTELQKDQLSLGIVNGLHFLHTNNIVHRDLKPSNVLITQKEHEVVPKITDFGLSKAVENINVTFKTNSFIGGTIKYSAPEQLLNTKTKGNVDIWSLGVILYEIFVGKVPFDVDTENGSTDFQRIESLRKITEGKVPNDIELIREPYKNIIKKCLIVNPDLRLQSIDHVLRILEEFRSQTEGNHLNDDKTILILKNESLEKVDLKVSTIIIDKPIDEKDKDSISEMDNVNLLEKTEIKGKIEINGVDDSETSLSPIIEETDDEIVKDTTLISNDIKDEKTDIDPNSSVLHQNPIFIAEGEGLVSDIESGQLVESPDLAEKIDNQNQINKDSLTEGIDLSNTETLSSNSSILSNNGKAQKRNKPKSKISKQKIVLPVLPIKEENEDVNKPSESSISTKSSELVNSEEERPNKVSFPKLTINSEKGLALIKNKKVWVGISILLLGVIWVVSGSSLQIIKEENKYVLKRADGSLANNKVYDRLEKSLWNGFTGQISDTTFTINRKGIITRYQVSTATQLSNLNKKNSNDSIQQLMHTQHEAAWIKASQENTLDAYESFVVNNPSSQHTQQAKDNIKTLLNEVNTNKEESLWAYAQKTNSISAYQMYLEKFQKGKQIAMVRQKIKELNMNADEELWAKTVSNNSILFYKEYLKALPNGIHANEAKSFIMREETTDIDKDIVNKEEAEKTNQTKNDVIDQVKPNDPEIDKNNNKTEEEESPFFINLEKRFVKIPRGVFTLGCEGEDCPNDSKGGGIRTIDAFYMSKYEITQELYTDVMGKNPSEFQGCGKCPVESISYADIGIFINKLNELPGNKHIYRLPTEEEWEYAALANENKEFAGSNDLEDVGISKVNNVRWTAKVGSKKPNKFGLFDMSGNVYEICKNAYSPKGYAHTTNGKIVIRGGSWGSNYEKCKVKTRSSVDLTDKSPAIGFRLVHD